MRSTAGRATRDFVAAGVLAGALLAPALAVADPVAADGVSHLDVSFGRVKVQVELEARDRVVTTLGLRVDGYALPVPPAAFADLVGPSTFVLERRDDGMMELHIVGGDAGGASSAVIVFDRLGVRERRNVDAATGAVMQSTVFSAPELLD